MKNIIIFCLFLTSLTLAQRQSVVVLPSLADPESKIAPKQLDLLTEEVRTIVTKTLPTKDFNLLKQSEVQEALGDEAFVNACEEGTCVGDLMKKVQANFGARCEIFTVSKQLYMKFELYGTLKGQREAGTIDQFNEPVQNFMDMQAKIKNETPAMFLKITRTPQELCKADGNLWMNGVCKTKEQIAQEACESKGNNWAWTDGDCKSSAQIACEVTTGRKWVGQECKTTEQIDYVAPAPAAAAAAPAAPAAPAPVAAAPTVKRVKSTDKKTPAAIPADDAPALKKRVKSTKK